MLADPDDAVWDEIVRALVSIGEPALDVLINATKNEDVFVRQGAIRAYLEIQGKSVCSEWRKPNAQEVAILRVGLSDKNINVRRTTIEYIPECYDDPQIMELLIKFSEFQDQGIRKAAQKKIFIIRVRTLRKYPERILQYAGINDSTILHEVIQLSENITDAGLVMSIIREMRPHFDAMKQTEEISSVIRIPEPDDGYIVNVELLSTYLGALRSIHPDIRKMAAESICKKIDAGDRDQWLLTIAFNVRYSSDPLVRRCVAITAKVFKYIWTLETLVFDSDDEVRRHALTGLLTWLSELIPASGSALQADLNKLDKGDSNPELWIDAINNIPKSYNNNQITDMLKQIILSQINTENLRILAVEKLNISDQDFRDWLQWAAPIPDISERLKQAIDRKLEN